MDSDTEEKPKSRLTVVEVEEAGVAIAAIIQEKLNRLTKKTLLLIDSVEVNVDRIPSGNYLDGYDVSAHLKLQGGGAKKGSLVKGLDKEEKSPKNMTVAEVMEARTKMAARIQSMLDEFTLMTGMKVDSVEVDTLRAFLDEPFAGYIVSVHLKL